MKTKFDEFPQIETARLYLRKLNEDDAQALFDYQSNKENFVHVDMPVYKEVSEAASYIQRMNKGVEQGRWMIWGIVEKSSKNIIGTVSVWNYNETEKKAELGYGTFPKNRRKGYMKEALQAVLEFAFNIIDLDWIEAYTSHYNQASIDFLSGIGFDFVQTIEDTYSPNGLMDVFAIRKDDTYIKRASLSDIPQIESLIQSVLRQSNSEDYPDKVIDFMCSYYSKKSIEDKFEDKTTWIVKPYKGDKLIGTIALKDTEIQALFVDATVQKGGYGKKLLMEAEKYAKVSGIKKLHLSASLTAKIFYEKMGYQHLALEDDENFGKAYLMEKSL